MINFTSFAYQQCLSIGINKRFMSVAPLNSKSTGHEVSGENSKTSSHLHKARNLKKGNSKILNALIKYGYLNFEFKILETIEFLDFQTKSERRILLSSGQKGNNIIWIN